MVNKLKKGGIDNSMIERILDEVLESTSGIKFDDVIGHQQAKSTLKEMLVLPAMRPDLFTGENSTRFLIRFFNLKFI